MAHSSEVIITVGHRPFPVQLVHVADHFFILVDKMADQKRRAPSDCSTSASKRTKCQVTVATCEKWQRVFDCEFQTLLWLRYDIDKADRSLVVQRQHFPSKLTWRLCLTAHPQSIQCIYMNIYIHVYIMLYTTSQ